MSKGDKYAQKSKVCLFFLSCNLVSPLSHVKKTISGPGWFVGREKFNEFSHSGKDGVGGEGESLALIQANNQSLV